MTRPIKPQSYYPGDIGPELTALQRIIDEFDSRILTLELRSLPDLKDPGESPDPHPLSS
jgi:hypothetical protein